MNQNVYEAMFILDSNRYARDPAGTSSQISSLVEKSGGEILVSRLWEERRLAYPIQGQRKGTYWLTYFRIDSGKIGPLERDFLLSEDVLRSLVLKVDARIADTLVEHARSGSLHPSRTIPVPAIELEDEIEEDGIGIVEDEIE